ncbi:MAG: 4Fe-4S binding protein [Deltaproteobacteria bacterium]|nr:4Fe-4S binding protein [Deltaproteobacteria bacterium]
MAGSYAVNLDFEACKACGYCRLVCPRGVYREGPAFNRKGFKVPLVAEESLCTGCLRCFYVCPDFCLDITPSASGAVREKTL